MGLDPTGTIHIVPSYARNSARATRFTVAEGVKFAGVVTAVLTSVNQCDSDSILYGPIILPVFIHHFSSSVPFKDVQIKGDTVGLPSPLVDPKSFTPFPDFVDLMDPDDQGDDSTRLVFRFFVFPILMEAYVHPRRQYSAESPV